MSATPGTTLTVYDPEPLRPSESETVQEPILEPGTVAGGIVKRRLKIRSPAVVSPFVPSSNRGDEEPSPAQLRSQLTERPVLAGFVPGVTAAVIVNLLPGVGSGGAVVTFTVGDVGVGVPSQATSADALLRGPGTPVLKSAALLSVSVQPESARTAPFVLLSVAVGKPTSEQVLTGLQRAAEVGFLPRRSGRRRVLHRPAAQVDRRAAAVEHFDEVVLQRCAGVAAASVDLADHERRADCTGLLHRSCKHVDEREHATRARAETSGCQSGPPLSRRGLFGPGPRRW